MLKRHSQFLKSLLFCVDLGLICACWIGAYHLRFSEIIFPDSSADGPFGKTFNRKLTSAGRYQLIIAPHQMASSSRAGDFTLEFELLAAEDVK